MKNANKKFQIASTLILFVAQAALADQKVAVAPKDGAVQFIAIGQPSALRIEGKGEGPEGSVILKKDAPDANATADMV
jgi:hypothetical protein